MDKRNKKIIQRIRRFERWYNITDKLSEFPAYLIQCYNGASPEEVKKLKMIQEKLHECYLLASEHLQEVKI